VLTTKKAKTVLES